MGKGTFYDDKFLNRFCTECKQAECMSGECDEFRGAQRMLRILDELHELTELRIQGNLALEFEELKPGEVRPDFGSGLRRYNLCIELLKEMADDKGSTNDTVAIEGCAHTIKEIRHRRFADRIDWNSLETPEERCMAGDEHENSNAG